MKYTKESLGRIAVFLLPSLKLKKRERGGKMVEEKLHDFLLGSFSGYTAATGNIFGYWKDPAGKEFYGEHKEFKVSLQDKEGIPVLEEFLAQIARDIDEDCIYLETGEDTWLVYPA
jgi:hypothetical protein